MTHAKRVYVSGAAVVALAALAGWLWPVPKDIPPGSLPAEDWRIPSASEIERSNATLINQARAIHWPSTGAGSADGNPDASWTLAGIVLDEGVPIALVRPGSGTELLRLQEGASLPDGHRLARVERDAIVVDAAGCLRRHPLYPDVDGNEDARGCTRAPSSPGSATQ